MPKFKIGDPQLVFIRKDGKTFTKTFHSRETKNKAAKGWKAAGGTIAGVSLFGKKYRRDILGSGSSKFFSR